MPTRRTHIVALENFVRGLRGQPPIVGRRDAVVGAVPAAGTGFAPAPAVFVGTAAGRGHAYGALGIGASQMPVSLPAPYAVGRTAGELMRSDEAYLGGSVMLGWTIGELLGPPFGPVHPLAPYIGALCGWGFGAVRLRRP